MAITFIHKVINTNKVRIVNKNEEPKKQVETIFAKMKTDKHTIRDVKSVKR